MQGKTRHPIARSTATAAMATVATATLPTPDIYLPPRSRLKLPSSLNGTGESGEELHESLIKALLRSVRLEMPNPYVMKTMGSISVKQNSNLISCLLFKRDESSEGIVIFDILRLATAERWRRRGYATGCLDALNDLLRHNFPGRKIILRVGALRFVRGFYIKAGFVKGVPKGLSEGCFCGQSDCNVYHLEVGARTEEVAVTVVVEEEEEGDIETDEEEEEHQPTPHSLQQIASIDSLQTRLSLAQQPQLQQPNIEIFCSSHSQMRVRDQTSYDTPVLEVSQNREDAFEDLFGRMGLTPLKNMCKVGSVCVKLREKEVSCLLFIRDDASLATNIRIFYIPRFTVGSDKQSQAVATLCLDAFTMLLCQNFPCATIIVRAAVSGKRQSFYERAGFQKGVPGGISKGLCGHSDCKTYHLVVQERHPTSANKKRKRISKPARLANIKPFQVQDRVVWLSKTWNKKKEKDLPIGCVKKVKYIHDSKYQYFVQWDNWTQSSWVDHKNLLSAVEVACRFRDA